MAFSVSPSVIVREVDASQSVPAIATPPAAMAGVFRWGPTNEPILITSENDLVNRFGTPNNNNYETFFVAADYLSYSNALYVVRADAGANTAAGADTLVYDANNALLVDDSTYHTFDAKYPGDLGNSIKVVYTNADGYGGTLADAGDIPALGPLNVIDANTGINSVENDIAFNASAVDFQLAPDDRLSVVPIAGDIIEIGNESIGYANLVLTAFTETPQIQLSGANNEISTTVAYDYALTFSNKYTLAETNLNNLSIKKSFAQSSLFTRAPDANALHIAVIDADGLITGQVGSILEKFENVSTTEGAVTPQGATNYYETVIENFSSWIQVANTAPLAETGAIVNRTELMVNGTAGRTETTATLANLAEAYDLFKEANEIDISFLLQGKGDEAATRANYLISNIAEVRKDCVVFCSPTKEAVVDELKANAKLTNAIAYRNKVQNSSYWFMDSGYKYRYDRYNDVYRWVPLNGDMAGLAARVEPWESPAGYRKGVIKNVVKLAFNPGKAHRDQLYSSDINPVMSQTGQGVVLFGDKTGLGLSSAFDRLNVRRLFIAVEKSIASASKSFLFELNDEFTQTQFKNIVDPFLRDIQGRRGIIDFRVISDSTVNTPEVVDQNKFRASIFIKPARSINVIELTFVATRSGIEFDEIVGQLS
jgi:hypothetical protein